MLQRRTIQLPFTVIGCLAYAASILYIIHSGAALPTCSEADFLGSASCSSGCALGAYSGPFCQCKPCPRTRGTGPFDRKVYHCLVIEFKVCPLVVACDPTRMGATRCGNSTGGRTSGKTSGSDTSGKTSGSDTSSKTSGSDTSSKTSGSKYVAVITITGAPEVNATNGTSSVDHSSGSYAAQLSTGLTLGILAVVGCAIGLACWRGKARVKQGKKAEQLCALQHDQQHGDRHGLLHQESLQVNVINTAQYPASIDV